MFKKDSNLVCHLILIRHGETAWNAEGRYQGRTDIDLNENGKKQALKLAEMYKDSEIDAIYSSHLIRAKNTAKIILGSKQIPHLLENDLQEGSYGALEGMKMVEVSLKFEKELIFASTLSSSERMHFKLVSDQETGNELSIRATTALKKIAKKHLGKTVLIVTHGGIIRSLLVSLAQANYSSIYIKNGQSISLIGTEDFLEVLVEELL